eukprot:CAMPEP_0168201896 /NCGR_PEP_ID=MMETSP0139_2-20121125/23974_1 /TAXON_ID=44445 /ORGANISM="Pseudo-nitzschia australis, Strain 10249 10 AB" /LENGTH=282 /DNA_ID=CAMNT_0008127529 /DNA_START=101 /DNA_END=949 /DNA_ORIENTATION=+
MSNIRGLYDDKKDDSSDDEKDSNNRYVGGIGARGGGSGLAVEPNNANADDGDAPGGTGRGNADSIFNLAEAAGGSAGGEDNHEAEEEIRRTITMYRDGFVVDDGPYRRLDDPANKEFLRSLAKGQTPAELRDNAGTNTSNLTVGLVDKRQEDYVQQFRSFSGAGQSLRNDDDDNDGGESSVERPGVFDPSNLTATATAATTAATTSTTSIAVRMLDGKRKVVKIAPTATVAQLAARAFEASNTPIDVPFRIVSGFPPKPLLRSDQTIEEAGLKGAQVQLQKA